MARQSAQTLFDNEYYKFITNANSLLLESLENCELTNEANGARKSKHELQYLGKSSIETGSFVYLFGLFEQFLNASIIIFAKSRLKRGEAYFQVFRREASKRNANGDDSFYKAGLISKERQLSFINQLPIFDIAELMFSFDKKNNDNLYSGYVELRERRNLLMHRGTMFDQRYFNVLSKTLNCQGDKIICKLKSKIGDNADYFAFDVGLDARSDITYLMHTHTVLFRLATKFYLSTRISSSFNKSQSVLPFDLSHSMMTMACSNPFFPQLLATEPIMEVILNRANLSYLQIHDLDIANLVINMCWDCNGEKFVTDSSNERMEEYFYLIEKIVDDDTRELVEYFVRYGGYEIQEKLLSFAFKKEMDVKLLNNWFITKVCKLSF